MRRRVLTLAIAVVLICSLFTSFAFAATLRASDYISSYNAVIYSSGTKINVDCSILQWNKRCYIFLYDRRV